MQALWWCESLQQLSAGPRGSAVGTEVWRHREGPFRVIEFTATCGYIMAKSVSGSTSLLALQTGGNRDVAAGTDA
jgi:hypothetical protein